MAKAVAAVDPKDIKFDMPDDVFGDEGDDDAPEPIEAKEDEPKAKKEKRAAEPEPEEEDEEPAATVEAAPEEDDAPPLEEPNDPNYTLAVERARREDLERRLAEIDERTRLRPEDLEANEARQIQEAKNQLRQRIIAARRAGDDDVLQEASWQLQDLEREEARRDTERQIRAIRGRQEEPQSGRGRLSPQEAQQQIVQHFRTAHRVTAEEERAIAKTWPEFAKKNPAWQSPHINLWALMEKQVKLVRSKPSAPPPAAAVESGSRAQSAPSKGSGSTSKLSKGELAKLAGAFGMTVDEYRKQPWAKGAK